MECYFFHEGEAKKWGHAHKVKKIEVALSLTVKTFFKLSIVLVQKTGFGVNSNSILPKSYL